MGTAFAPAKVTSLVVEDNRTDRLHIAQKLSSAKIFDPVFYDNYRKHLLMQKAKDADIVSLDLEVETLKSQSLFVCKQLKTHNPDKSVIFFTSNPKEVLTQPINFVLGKSEQVWESYDRLLMMILVHDRSFSLLRDVVDLSGDREKVREHYEEMRARLSPFISSLLSIQKVFKKENKTIARRYRKLTRVLKKMHAVSGDEEQIAVKLHKMQEPLMGFVRQELADLKQVEGVYATQKLENEILDLDHSIMQQDAMTDTRGISQRVIVYTADKLAGSLRSVSEYLSRDVPAGTSGMPDSSSSEPDEEPSLYLNAWFPDYDNKDAITVEVPAELRINLDYFITDGKLGGSQQIPPERAELLNAAGSVDIMVMCPNADIEPLIGTLDLPPKPDHFVKFDVTAREPGPLDLTVLLLLRNEPIYRTVFSCEVVRATDNPAVHVGSRGSGREVEISAS